MANDTETATHSHSLACEKLYIALKGVIETMLEDYMIVSMLLKRNNDKDEKDCEM